MNILILDKRCKKIIGGKCVSKNQFPWVVGLFAKRPFYDDHPFCGASLISNKHLLTAAHCIEGVFLYLVIELIGTKYYEVTE